MIKNQDKIFVAGHNGMLGSAILRQLEKNGYSNIITANRNELDLLDSGHVKNFLSAQKPECVILAAAKVGGINANIKNPVGFLQENLIIQSNVISHSYSLGVKKFVFLGSSCIYPKESPQPIKEEYLLSGKLEPTNEGYAIAKIAGLKLIEYYHKQFNWDAISLMPCNLYGPNDSFDLEHSHVLSALVRRFIDAKYEGNENITLWGTGEAKREFMHVDDAARAVIYFMNNYSQAQFINVGSGVDISIKNLANEIANLVQYEGSITWDDTKPNGMMRKCLDVTRMKEMGFEPQISLAMGLQEMINIYKSIKTSLK